MLSDDRPTDPAWLPIFSKKEHFMGNAFGMIPGLETDEWSNDACRGYVITYTQGDHVPAWAVNPHSELVPLACEVYSELTGRNMVVEPVHGGLECGAFFEKNPDLDMIAIGPSLTDVHSPDESCDIESIRVTAELVIRILEKLA